MEYSVQLHQNYIFNDVYTNNDIYTFYKKNKFFRYN